MFTTPKERYFYHINCAKFHRNNIVKWTRMANHINTTPSKKTALKRLIDNTIDKHRGRLIAAKMERTTTYYKSL